MTSDAKVGLLLGLVFIFIVAFVINGLPRFRSAVNSAEATTNMVSVGDDFIGIGSRERKAQDTINWMEFENEPAGQEMLTYEEDNTNNNNITEVVQDNRIIVEEPQYADVSWDSSGNNIPYSIDKPESVRYTLPLTPQPYTNELPRPVSSGNNYVASEPPASMQEFQPSQQQHIQPPQMLQQIQQSNRTERVIPQNMKSYTVEQGDSLSTIAKKFYGPEQGNRLAVVNMLFEANQDVLESIDSLDVGQEIAIPPLPSSLEGQKTTDIFAGEQFKQVGSIPGGPADTGRWYEVKEDDNLWDISSEQLGKGSRYTEIITLNSDKLTEANNYRLRPGMLLQLPKQ